MGEAAPTAEGSRDVGPVQTEKRGLSAQTVQHVHRTLSQALSHAVQLGVLLRNPAGQVKPPRPEQREIKILSKDEIGVLLKAAKGSPLSFWS